MTTQNDYQQAELRRHDNEMSRRGGYFANVAEFDASMKTTSTGWIKEQTSWIINGSYGAGACFAFQRAARNMSARCNREAIVGQFILSCLYGRTWKSADWHKLSARTRREITKAARWFIGLKAPKWAQVLE